MNSPKKAVVLLSGGMDSATVLALVSYEGYEVHAMSFNYNQRHAVELEAARKLAAAWKTTKHLIINFDLREIGGSALTSNIDVPKLKSEENKDPLKTTSGVPDFQTSGLIPVTYVPARNTIFLSFALAWAEVLHAEEIFIGANALDYSGYPDCRPQYLRAFENMSNLATKESVEGRMRFHIQAPLLAMKKSDIIKKGTELGLDYALTWSCYDPKPVQERGNKVLLKLKSTECGEYGTSGLSDFRTFKPCGLCDSCRLREKGFIEAGLTDPLISVQEG